MSFQNCPEHLPKADIEQLSNIPGVYHFYGERDHLLYVGKSVELRKRVLSHFNPNSTHRADAKIIPLIRKITYFETPTDFGAQLLECEHIKTLSPMLNRKLRRAKRLFQFVVVQNKDGYSTVSIESTQDTQIASITERYGLFKTKAQALAVLNKLGKTFKLCDKLIGKEKGNQKTCFAFQLKRCLGACCGQEDKAQYNKRILEALLDYKMQTWPWQGPIVIQESSKHTPKTIKYHIVDQWVYLAQYQQKSSLTKAIKRQTFSTKVQLNFSLDDYLIFVRFLFNQSQSDLKEAGLTLYKITDNAQLINLD